MSTIALSESVLTALRRRRSAGESVKAMATEVGVTWQKLDKALRHGSKPAVSAALVGAMTERYRPRTLASVFGQPAAMRTLRGLVANPYPTALLFEGETGTGKTSAALALAADLGCDVEHREFGGLYVIAGGEQTAETVRETFDHLHHTPFRGSGWKVLVINEADRMNQAVETIWLDRLENIPPKSIVVFTTNHTDKLSRRLLDRCISVHFDSSPEALDPALQDLLRGIWKAETGTTPPRNIMEPLLKAARLEAIQDGQLSFRRAVRFLEKTLLAAEGAKA